MSFSVLETISKFNLDISVVPAVAVILALSLREEGIVAQATYIYDF